MYQTIKAALSSAAPTYDPGVQMGEVKAPYLVVHDMGINPHENSGGMLGQHIYEVVALVPVARQGELKLLCERARAALKSIPRLKYSGDAAPTGIEAQFKGVSVSLVYRLPVVIQKR